MLKQRKNETRLSDEADICTFLLSELRHYVPAREELGLAQYNSTTDSYMIIEEWAFYLLFLLHDIWHSLMK